MDSCTTRHFGTGEPSFSTFSHSKTYDFIPLRAKEPPCPSSAAQIRKSATDLAHFETSDQLGSICCAQVHPCPLDCVHAHMFIHLAGSSSPSTTEPMHSRQPRQRWYCHKRNRFSAASLASTNHAVTTRRFPPRPRHSQGALAATTADLLLVGRFPSVAVPTFSAPPRRD